MFRVLDIKSVMCDTYKSIFELVNNIVLLLFIYSKDTGIPIVIIGFFNKV